MEFLQLRTQIIRLESNLPIYEIHTSHTAIYAFCLVTWHSGIGGYATTVSQKSYLRYEKSLTAGRGLPSLSFFPNVARKYNPKLGSTRETTAPTKPQTTLLSHRIKNQLRPSTPLLSVVQSSLILAVSQQITTSWSGFCQIAHKNSKFITSDDLEFIDSRSRQSGNAMYAWF